jgi:NitT/TauT family transport system substrate-binding protein
MRRLGLLGLLLLVVTVLNTYAETTKVRLGYLRNDLHHLPAWVAIEKGFFREKGLDVEVAGIFNAGPEQMSAFASKSIDIGYLGMAPSVTGLANRSASVKAVKLSNTEGSAIVVRKDSDINDIKALEGKTIAIPGHATVQDFLIRKAIDNAGIDIKRVNMMVIKPPEMIPALTNKQIDAFIAWEPHPSKAVSMGVGRVLMPSSKIWKGHPCCVVAVQGDFYKSNPKVVKAFAEAHVKANDFIKKNPDEAFKIAQKYTGMDEATIRLAMKNINYEHHINEKDIKEYMDYLQKFGYIKPLDVEQFIREYTEK